MKHLWLINLLIICVCILLGVFIVLSTDISSDFIDGENIHRSSVTQFVLDENDSEINASDNITEDPEVGILYVPYDYSMPAPESEAVEISHFDKSVFIGDSRMLGLIRYTDISPINYCSVGFSVDKYDSVPFVRVGEENLTVKDALRKNDDFDAVYIATGLNELGWPTDKFAHKYKEMVVDIKSVAGSRPVYIQLIMPVTNSFEVSRIMNPFNIRNNRVPQFNERLVELAVECRIFYLDCEELFSLEDGTLDPVQSTDGAHLTRDAYSKQLEYYKTHVVQTKNRVFI